MKRNILISLLAIFMLSACGGQKTVVKKFYMIENPEPEMLADQDTMVAVDARCEVEEVEVYPAYATRRIIFRDASHQVRYFGNNEWAVSPSEALTPLIIDYLSGNKIFSRVSGRFWDKSPDFRLQTTIFKIEVATTENNEFEAHIELRFELIDALSDTVVVSHLADKKALLESKSLNLAAATISEIFHKELNNFAAEIKERVSHNK